MISCNCRTNSSKRVYPHDWNCNFLKNKLDSFCCDDYMESSTLSSPIHDSNCPNMVKDKPKKAMWVRLMVFEGEKEWVNKTMNQSKEGYTQVDKYNSVTSTSVCYRDTTLEDK